MERRHRTSAYATVPDGQVNRGELALYRESQTDLRDRLEALEAERQSRVETEQELVDAKERYERLLDTIPCALYDYIRWPDGRNRFLYMSSQCRDIFELKAEAIIDSPSILWEMVHPEDLERLKQEDFEANRCGRLFTSEVRILLSGGRTKWIQLTSMPSSTVFDSQTVWSGVILDITQRKQAEEEGNRLMEQLKAAASTIDSLEEIVPICSFCKDIRNDEGYWDKVEAYIARHSGKQLSHGICPDCAREHYPEMSRDSAPLST